MPRVAQNEIAERLTAWAEHPIAKGDTFAVSIDKHGDTFLHGIPAEDREAAARESFVIFKASRDYAEGEAVELIVYADGSIVDKERG